MKRDGFSSQFGALVAMVGSAVGLGSLWKFPYVTGENGGAAFIILYILFLFVLCLPLILAELVLGRRSQKSPVGAFKTLAPKSKWYLTGLLGTITAFVILSFYSVVGGWTIEYIISSLYKGIDTVSSNDRYFKDFVSHPFQPIIMHLLFLGGTVGILWTGVKDGIEKYSKLLMPLLFIMVVGLAIFAVTLPGGMEGVKFMLMPRFEDVTSGVILQALGMGLFTLSLGMAIVMTYSSYLSGKENLIRLSLITIFFDVMFALLAGLMILPAVFAFGYSPAEGPGLLFIILPKVFAQLPFGSGLSALFFVVVFIASITSSISLLEVIIAYLSEEWKITRKKALVLSGAALAVTGSICSLSLGDYSIFTWGDKSVFDWFDFASSGFMMPLCALLISLFVGWVMKKSDFYDELSNQSTIKVQLFGLLMFLIRYFVPAAIILIFLNGLGLFDFLIK